MIFALLVLRGVSHRSALIVAGLGAVASLIWPYSKIGMDTTLMAAFAATVLAAAGTARSPTPGRFALLGVAAALTANSKPYGIVLVLGVVPLLFRPFLELSPERRVRVAAAVVVPVLLGVVAIGWYNWYRTGSITNFDNAYTSELLATPINAIGLLASPGKGLLLYSPLVVLGLIGLRRMWNQDRPLAQTVAVAVALNVLVIAASAQWGDETWGPRYLLPSAWLLLLPLAWWPRDRRHMLWLRGIAIVAVLIQVAAVLSRYYVSAGAARALAGEPVYGPPGGHVAYGDDGPRWIPKRLRSSSSLSYWPPI